MNALITSLSHKVPLLEALRTALARIEPAARVIGGDLDAECVGRYFCDAFWPMPPDAELTLDALAAYCREHRVRWIVPTRDGELPFYARHRAALAERGIEVMVSPPEAVERCLDKLAFHEVCRELGFPAIPTATTPDDLDAPAYVVKERRGAGAREIGVNLRRAAALAHGAMLREPLYQPYVVGEEYSVDLYVAADGRCRGAVARRRLRVVDGESQVTETARAPELERLCAGLAESLGLYGHAVVQLIVDAAGAPHIVECNPRFGGASTLGVAAGLDSFFWFLNESLGRPLDEHGFVREARTLRLVRYPRDRIV